MVILDKYLEATFSLIGEDEAECIEGVEVFKYLGRLLYRLEDDWPAVLRNIRKVRQVWGHLGKILQRKGSYPSISEKLNCVAIQVVLLFGEDTWVLLAPMTQKLEGVPLGFLIQVTKLKTNILKDRLWRKVAAEIVLQGAVTQPLQTYLDRR